MKPLKRTTKPRIGTTRRRQPERAIQSSIVDFLRYIIPHVLVFAIPNGAPRNTYGLVSHYVPGLTPGIPDLAVCLRGGRIVFLEIKTKTGRASDVQIAIHGRLNALGHDVAVVRNLDDVRRALKIWNIETRETK
jgi:hypothetical protein